MYKVELTAPVTRASTIAGKLKGNPPLREFFGFRNRKSDLPLIQVPIDLPVYRMANFRTFTDQRDFIAEEDKPSDYFSSGQESEAVQQDQHELLYRLAQKGVADSVVPVSSVLEKEGQRQPLLITANGVVVNLCCSNCSSRLPVPGDAQRRHRRHAPRAFDGQAPHRARRGACSLGTSVRLTHRGSSGC